jgi:hypothetical protein
MYTLPHFLFYTAVGFGPLIFAYVMLLMGFTLNALIAVVDHSLAGAAQFVSYTTVLVVVLIAAIWASYAGFQKSTRWRSRALILYGCWFILALIPIFFLTLSIAGGSMAAVDNALARGSLIQSSLREGVLLLLYAQIIIIPWVAGATWVMRRFNLGQAAA